MPLLRKASNWAQLHPRSSRFIIAIATILSVFLHYYYGVYLFAYEITIPYSLAILGIILGVTAALLYPIKHHKTGIFAYSYRKQKALDFFIFMIGGLLVMYLGNRRAANVYTEFEAQAEISQVITTENATATATATAAIYVPVSAGNKGQGPKKRSTKFSRSEIRKQLKSNFKELKKALRHEIRELRKQRKKGQEGDGKNVLLTILAILGALALGFLVAALACSISCNGNELLGSIVLIVGWAGILVLAFFTIKKIFGRNKEPDISPKNSDSSYPY